MRFYFNTVVSYLHCSFHIVCIIHCEIFIRTLLCDTYILLHFVCIIPCEIFILTLLCHTYIFLHSVCVILCEILFLTLLCHSYIRCQFVSSLVRFLFTRAFHTCLGLCHLCTYKRMFSGNFTKR